MPGRFRVLFRPPPVSVRRPGICQRLRAEKNKETLRLERRAAFAPAGSSGRRHREALPLLGEALFVEVVGDGLSVSEMASSPLGEARLFRIPRGESRTHS